MTTPTPITQNKHFQGTFDQVKLDDAIAEREKVRNQYEYASEKYNELFDKSHENGVAISDADNAAISRWAVNRKGHLERLQVLDGDIKAMEARKPTDVVKTSSQKSDMYALMNTWVRAKDIGAAREMSQDPAFEGLLEMTSDAAVFNLDIPNLRELHKQMTAGSLRSDNSTGESIVETDTMADVIHKLLFFGDVSQVARTLNTGKGNPVKYPKADNVTRKGRVLLNQSTSTTHRPIANFEDTEIGVNTITSDRCRIANELIEDDIVDVVGITWDELVRSIARTKNEVLTDGLASSEFTGLADIAKVGVTTAAADKFTLKEIVKLLYSVNRAYRKGNEGNAMGRMKEGRGMNALMISDHFEEQLVGLLDLEGKPLWNPNARDGLPRTIYGVTYVVNDDLDDVVSGGIPAVVGCFDHFLVRNSGPLRVHNFFDSNTALDNERELVGFHRCGSALIGPQDSSNKSDSIAKMQMA